MENVLLMAKFAILRKPSASSPLFLQLSGWMVRRAGQSAKKGEYVTCQEVLLSGGSQSFVKVAPKAKVERETKSLNQNE